MSPPAEINQRRQRIELDDGDFIDLDWAGDIHPEASANGTIVVLIHGLCGCSGSPYIIALQTLLAANNIANVAMNFRGCSGDINRLAKAYHSGISEDVNAVYTKLFEQYPKSNFAFVGYSLGANVLLKYLGESQGHRGINKAVAISTPFSLAACSRAMLSGVSKIYGRYFVRRLLGDFYLKQQHFADSGDSEQQQQISRLGDLSGISTIWEFDDLVTAPLHGFRDAEDYYAQCSSIGFIDSIKTDTLLIQSQNDPLIPSLAIPKAEQLAANIDLHLSDKGGHVGFICGNRNNWLEQRILDYIVG